MPEIYEDIGDDPDIKQNIREAALLLARKLIYGGAKQHEQKRQNSLKEYCLPYSAEHRPHYRIRLGKPSAEKQRLGAYPIGQIQKIKKEQPYVK